MPQRLKLKEHQQLPYLTVLRKMWFILTILEGWSAAILPLAHDDIRLGERYELTPAGVLAGALAVAEAFQFLRGNQPVTGRRR